MSRAGNGLRRARAWAAGLGPWPILIAGWAAFLVYAYPGYMSSDSVDQLLDARVGTFNDWHSPTMTEVWRWVSFAIAGPFGMLALQSLLLQLGAYALAARSMPARSAAMIASGLVVFPPVIAVMAVIWQDSQMAGFLVAGLAAITSRRRGAQAAGLGLLVLAAAMRASAAFAVLPLLVIGWTWRADRRASWRRLAAAGVVWVAVWLAAVGLDVGLRSTPTGHVRTDLAAVDVVGTLRYAGPLDDGAVRKLLPGVKLLGTGLAGRAATDAARGRNPMEGPDRLFDPPQNYGEARVLAAAQSHLAVARPRAYLVHRWHMLYRVLEPTGMRGGNSVYSAFAGSEVQADAALHMAQHSGLQALAVDVVSALDATPLCWVFLYFVAAIPLLVLAVRRRQLVPTALLASGLSYELSLFFAASAPTYVLSHWLVTATCLAGAMIALGALQARRSSAGVAPALASYPPDLG